MQIASWNVNSVRTRLDQVLAWLEQVQPDLLCLQETKVDDPLFPREAFEAAGWQVNIHGQKAYNGVALVSREPLEDVRCGFDAELPTRSSETVKQSLGIFEQSTKRDIKQKRSVLPPIHAAKPPPPQIDDSQDVATGLTGTVKDARPDVTLPPVVPAAISMPVIIDD